MATKTPFQWSRLIKLLLGVCPWHHGPQDTRDPSIYGLDRFFQAFRGPKDCSQNKQPDSPPNQKAEYDADCLTIRGQRLGIGRPLFAAEMMVELA